jgi:putative ABC transport system substrate-binding protein
VELRPIDVRDVNAIESGVAASTAGGQQNLHRELIITLAARHKLPAVYSNRSFVTAGGLMSYGPNLLDLYRRAAGYVDRILKGERTCPSNRR